MCQALSPFVQNHESGLPELLGVDLACFADDSLTTSYYIFFRSGKDIKGAVERQHISS